MKTDMQKSAKFIGGETALPRRAMLLSLLAGAAIVAVPVKARAMGAEERCMKVIESQLKAFMSSDYDVAYSYAAPVIQRMYPDSGSFAEMVSRGYAAIFKPTSYAFGRAMERDGQRVQEVFITDQAGADWVALYSLAEFAGEFRITGVFLQRGGRST
ncbi:MAG: DUF4864 domain-containing protein [Pseudomonadota bacterium]